MNTPSAGTGHKFALEGRVRHLERALSQYDELLAELSETLAALTPTSPGGGRPCGTNGWTAWHASPELHAARLHELRPWVAWMNHTIAAGHCQRREPLPPCWEDHAGAVEELLALYAAWICAYTNPTASDTMVAWHDRWVGPTLQRILGGYALQTCHTENHCHLQRTSANSAK